MAKGDILEAVIMETDGKPWVGDNYFVISWVIEKYGFGTLTFSERESGLYCGDEFTPTSTVLNLVRFFCNQTPKEEWPQLLLKYETAENLVNSVVEWESPRK